jgi:hypothetical protein
LDRLDQSEEVQGFSLWRDVDDDRTPDIHEWSDESGSWVQDTRDYKGGSPRHVGPQRPRPEIRAIERSPRA